MQRTSAAQAPGNNKHDAGEGANKIALKDVIALVNKSEIASIKSVVSGIIEVINNPESSAKDLTDLVEADPPLAARVLKVANSAYYSPVRTVSEILQAVIMIGFDTLKEIILSQKIGELFQKKHEIDGFSRSRLWKHSVATAVLGKLIFRREYGERGDQMYTAGLLHNVGIIVEHQLFEKQFIEAVHLAAGRQSNLTEAEKTVFDFTHTEVGEAIAIDWGFPDDLVKAIAFHHAPEIAGDGSKRFPLTLSVADFVCHERGLGYSDAPFTEEDYFVACLNGLSLGRPAVSLIADEMCREIAKMEEKGVFGQA